MAKLKRLSPYDAERKVAPTPAKKSRRPLLLLFLMLLAAGGGAWTVVHQHARLDQVVGRIVPPGRPDPSGRPDVQEAPVYGQFTEIRGMVINPAGSSGRRYLTVNLGLEVEKTSVAEELAQKDVVVRDALLKLLGERTVEELADVALREELKKELRDTMNAVLREGQVSRVYFTQYVLQ